MGVIHKLKVEVVDFIVNQKRENPNVSCRSLVGIVQQTFNIKLSKSSINNILQSSQLSSPVGRRAIAGKKPKKFKLPPGAKDKLFKSTTQKEASSKSGDAMTSVKKPTTKKPSSPPVSTRKKPALPSKAATPLMKQSSIKEKGLALEDRVLLDHMGCIFLKASEWELSDAPIFGQFLGKYIKGGGLTDVNTAGEILTFLQPFGIKRVEDLPSYTKSGLWALHGQKNKVDVETLTSIISQIDDLKELAINYSIEMGQIFQEVSYFKLELENDDALWVDAETTALWPQKPPLPFATSINKGMTRVATKLLNNLSPVVLCCAHGQKHALEHFSRLIMSFEGVRGAKIKRIVVYGQGNQELAMFDKVPDKKRIFIAGLWPWQEEFGRFYPVVIRKECKLLESNDLSNKWYYKEATIPLDSHFDKNIKESIKLRIFFLLSSPKAEPTVAIITNASKEDNQDEDVILSYVQRWPNLEQGCNVRFVKQQYGIEEGGVLNIGSSSEFGGGSDLFCSDVNTIISTGYDFFDLTAHFISTLNLFCQRRFFPGAYNKINISTMISNVYGISGYLSESPESINFELLSEDVPPPISLQELDFAVRRVNEMAIRNYQGKKLVLSMIS